MAIPNALSQQHILPRGWPAVRNHSTSLQSCPCSYPQLIFFHAQNRPFVPGLCSLSLPQFLIHDRTLPFTPGLPSFSIASCAGLYQKPFESCWNPPCSAVSLTLSRIQAKKREHERRKIIAHRKFAGWHICRLFCVFLPKRLQLQE